MPVDYKETPSLLCCSSAVVERAHSLIKPGLGVRGPCGVRPGVPNEVEMYAFGVTRCSQRWLWVTAAAAALQCLSGCEAEPLRGGGGSDAAMGAQVPGGAGGGDGAPATGDGAQDSEEIDGGDPWVDPNAGEVRSSCSDCPLRLVVDDKRAVDGQLSWVRIGLDYSVGAAKARLADVRISVTGPAVLTEVEEGEALRRGGKQLYTDTATGKRWQRDADGNIRLLALSVLNTNPLPSGRLANLEFAVTAAPRLSFAIARREPILAPAEADRILQAAQYNQPLVVDR